MKIGILTSSRADFGIYSPLIKRFIRKKNIELELVVFGMHLIEDQGKTINQIQQEFPSIKKKLIPFKLKSTKKTAVALAYSKTFNSFITFWKENNYEFVFALGDRYEMSAAVQSGIFFDINFYHIHGGETTLGSLDNIFRHQISLCSKKHF